MIGQAKKVGIWTNHVDAEKSSEDEFTGKVVEVHSGDCLTIERDADYKLIRMFLSSVKAPKIT